MKTSTYQISCAMGSSRDWPFIQQICEELNQIGYSGTLNGKKTSYYDYFEKMSNEKINYHLTRTGGNGFDFTDEYMLVVTENTMSSKDLNSAEEAIVNLSEALGLSEKQVIEIISGGMMLETRGKLTTRFKEFLDEMTATFDAY
jgi:hypothetical protein